jgi:hypothetical protein
MTHSLAGGVTILRIGFTALQENTVEAGERRGVAMARKIRRKGWELARVEPSAHLVDR